MSEPQALMDSTTAPVPSNSRTGIWRHIGIALALLCLTALVYGRVGGFDYSGFDDEGYILDTAPVRAGLTFEGIKWAFSDFRMSNWHPLTWISHMTDVTLFDLDPGPMHVVNVAIHGLNGILVYVLSLLLLRHVFASVVVACLFLIHPLHVESVAWIAERKDLLCAFFFLCGLFSYVRYVAKPSFWRYTLILIAFVLALLSKPMAVTLPLILLLLDFWPLRRVNIGQYSILGRSVPTLVILVAEKAPLLVLSLLSGLITISAQINAIASLDKIPLDYRLMNAVISVIAYVRDMLLPIGLAAIYPFHEIGFLWPFLPALTIFSALCAIAFAWRHRFPWFMFGWVWFLVMLLPVIGLMQVGSQSRADRYVYLPSIGLFLAFASCFVHVKSRLQERIRILLFPALGFYCLLAWIQVGFWSNGYMVFARSLTVAGDSYQAHAGLSAYYLKIGMLDEAQTHGVEAVILGNRNAQSYVTLAMVLLAKNNNSGAERMLRLAIVQRPNDAEMMNNLGVAIEKQGRLDEARAYYERAKKLDPALDQAHKNIQRTGRREPE